MVVLGFRRNMEERRGRRGFGRRRPNSKLPIRRAVAGNGDDSSSRRWFYRDVKIFALNQPIFRFGNRRAAFLLRWFSAGIGFSVCALVAVSLILVWELARALRILRPNPLGDLFSSLLFGLSPVSAIRVSLADAGYLMVSTLISVGFHEFGHALAAASEGIQMDYIALFIVILFPGALVALNYDVVEALSPFASLRIYCAGIWHNALLCAVCGLALFLMPFILFPVYEQAESPMVLDVPSSSPLSPYLSPGDVIDKLDGIHINSVKEWTEMAAILNEMALRNLNNSSYFESVGRIGIRKGYCVPDFMVEESKKIEIIENRSDCPYDLASFVSVPCSDANILGDVHPKRIEQTCCLDAKEVIKFGRCGDSCTCSPDASCLSPVQIPGMVWVEISYSKRCSQKAKASDSEETKCGGSFVFVGDVISMASSVKLTTYRPRWEYFSPFIPQFLQRIFLCTFQVSLTLALLNSLPVYFLDGEYILEVMISRLKSLSSNKRRKFLRVALLAGTVVSVLTFFRIFLKFLHIRD